MTVNKTRLLDSFNRQIEQVEEKCRGYREELKSAVADIIQNERLHETRSINVQQKVSDICSRLGRFLDEGTENNSQS